MADSMPARSRRALLTAGLGAAAATVASALGRTPVARAANGDPLLMGSTNNATTSTIVDTTSGAGIQSTTASATGTGVTALNSGNGTALLAVSGAAAISSAAKIGVYGYANQDTNARAVYGKSLVGTGVWGNSDTGRGVFGRSTSGTAVSAQSDTGRGLYATTASTTSPAAVALTTGTKSALQAFAGPGSLPAPTPETAIEGECNATFNSIGVLGQSSTGTGVLGAGPTGVWGDGYYGVYGTGVVGITGDVDLGTGVQGWSGAAIAPDPGANIGVWAGAEAGRTALSVVGVARFTRSGRVTVAAGASTVAVTVPGGLTSSSFALANLQASRSGTWVQAVVPNTSTGKITIYLNKAVTTNTAVGWIVVA